MPCEPFTSPDGKLVGIICSRGRNQQVCHVCGKPMTALCDATRKDGKPCDNPMCADHKTRVAIDTDVCCYHNYPKFIGVAVANRIKREEDKVKTTPREPLTKPTESMTFRQLLGLNTYDTDKDGYRATHAEKYTTIVSLLGYEKVKACIPFTIEQIMEAYPKDECLNNLPIDVWTKASGFNAHYATVTNNGSPLTDLYSSVGVTAYSSSEGVCILKTCAIMWYNEMRERNAL